MHPPSSSRHRWTAAALAAGSVAPSAARRCTASAMSCCCAPSWMSRSIRRRSTTWAWGRCVDGSPGAPRPGPRSGRRRSVQRRVQGHGADRRSGLCCEVRGARGPGLSSAVGRGRRHHRDVAHDRAGMADWQRPGEVVVGGGSVEQAATRTAGCSPRPPPSTEARTRAAGTPRPRGRGSRLCGAGRRRWRGPRPAGAARRSARRGTGWTGRRRPGAFGRALEVLLGRAEQHGDQRRGHD